MKWSYNSYTTYININVIPPIIEEGIYIRAIPFEKLKGEMSASEISDLALLIFAEFV